MQVRKLRGRERCVQQIFRAEACADALLAEREQRFDVFRRRFADGRDARGAQKSASDAPADVFRGAEDKGAAAQGAQISRGDLAEGIYNEVGVLYTSIFLIPMRIVMWSVGTTYFVAGETVEKKKLIKNVLTHPCLVAIYLGLLCMVTQVQLPSVILNNVKYIGNCNSMLTLPLLAYAVG